MTVTYKTEQGTQTCYTSISLKPAEHKKQDTEHPVWDCICIKCSGKKIFGNKKQISGSLGLLVETVEESWGVLSEDGEFLKSGSGMLT